MYHASIDLSICFTQENNYYHENLSRIKIYRNTQEIFAVILILYKVDCPSLFHPPITKHSVRDSDTVAANAIGDGRSPT